MLVCKSIMYVKRLYSHFIVEKIRKEKSLIYTSHNFTHIFLTCISEAQTGSMTKKVQNLGGLSLKLVLNKYFNRFTLLSIG